MAHPSSRPLPDLADLRLPAKPRRALEIAAAGDHPLLLEGAPGSGATALARRLPSILPRPSSEESDALDRALDCVRGPRPEWSGCPFRAPHQSISRAGLVGSPRGPRPGEVTLAHGGVLYLDELPEFPRMVQELVRSARDHGEVTHSTLEGRRVRFPGGFSLVASTYSCPCHYSSDPTVDCVCSRERIERWWRRLGTLRHVFHLVVQLPPGLQEGAAGESSSDVARRVFEAQARQATRAGGPGRSSLNGRVPRLKPDGAWRPRDRRVFDDLVAEHGLSALDVVRLLRVARTIGDLAGDVEIEAERLEEALSFIAPLQRRGL